MTSALTSAEFFSQRSLYSKLYGCSPRTMYQVKARRHRLSRELNFCHDLLTFILYIPCRYESMNVHIYVCMNTWLITFYIKSVFKAILQLTILTMRIVAKFLQIHFYQIYNNNHKNVCNIYLILQQQDLSVTSAVQQFVTTWKFEISNICHATEIH